MDSYASLRSASVRSVALAIATAVQDEIEFERWVSDQAAEKKDDEEFGGKLLGALRRRYPTIDRKVWVKWRAKIDLVRDEPMDRIVALQFGSALLHCVTESNSKYVSISEVGVAAGKRELRLSATQYTIDLVGEITAIAEVAHPPLMPMICPPNPWRYEQ